ncbi:Sulfatase-modifying factor enzyme domain-containing protein [Desulfonema limicola]|uniref:Sulfatase-modifying factor enzyme domain-containing protein n=1 Tax=Desulfonema limicola TaxID=45656 RepID=A0A975BB78_9BACT|nr:formylglycine-generating enzyme family protein [Desulfonema limicola]QTA82444.1 Sulfatase-modifying factor enzyme domain-containing protein [Desulfonema limicola]
MKENKPKFIDELLKNETLKEPLKEALILLAMKYDASYCFFEKAKEKLDIIDSLKSQILNSNQAFDKIHLKEKEMDSKITDLQKKVQELEQLKSDLANAQNLNSELSEQQKELKQKLKKLEKIQEKLEKKESKPEKLWQDPVTGMEFVYVPGGIFIMGDVFGDGEDREKPVHEVRLSSFYIGKYQVTQGQWQKVMGNNPSNFKKGDNYPVETVSWDDVQEFIKKLSGLNQGKCKFSLPTEAQWEYACRSGGKREKYPGGDNIDDFAWYDSNSGGSTHPVGQKKANGLGIHDMSGNVWEWCQDWYGNYSADAVTDPAGSQQGSNRVIRGGSWSYGAQNCRSAYRVNYSPSSRGSNLGFRLVLSQVSR